MPLKIRLGFMSLVILFSVFVPVDLFPKRVDAFETVPAEPPAVVVRVIVVPHCSLPPSCATTFISVPTSKPINPLRQKVINLTKGENLTEKEVDDILIIASLIEKEGRDSFDRSIISAIIWNRLAKNMKLQLDVAPETYKHYGLPSAMITNPNTESIRAALNPAKTDALFFIHDKTGKIHFTDNFEQHKKNIEQYLKSKSS